MLLHSWCIILIPSQPVFALSPWWYLLSGEATNTNFIVLGLTGLETTIYHTWGEHANHYTTDTASSLRASISTYLDLKFSNWVPSINCPLNSLKSHLLLIFYSTIQSNVTFLFWFIYSFWISLKKEEERFSVLLP